MNDDLKNELNPNQQHITQNDKDIMPEPIKASREVYLERAKPNMNKSSINPNPNDDITKFECNNVSIDQPLEDVKKQLNFNNIEITKRIDIFPLDTNSISKVTKGYDNQLPNEVIKYYIIDVDLQAKLAIPVLLNYIKNNLARRNRKETNIKLNKLFMINDKYRTSQLGRYFYKMKLTVRGYQLIKKMLEDLKSNPLRPYYKKWKMHLKIFQLNNMTSESIKSLVKGLECQKLKKSIKKYQKANQKFNVIDSLVKSCLLASKKNKYDHIIRLSQRYYKSSKKYECIDSTSQQCKNIGLSLKSNHLKKAIAKYYKSFQKYQCIDSYNQSCNNFGKSLKLDFLKKVSKKYYKSIQVYSCYDLLNEPSMTIKKSIKSNTLKKLNEKYYKSQKKYQCDDILNQPCILKGSIRTSAKKLNAMTKKYYTTIPRITNFNLNDSLNQPKLLPISLKNVTIIKNITLKYTRKKKLLSVTNPTRNSYMLISQPDNVEMMSLGNLSVMDIETIEEKYLCKYKKHLFRSLTIDVPAKHIILKNSPITIVQKLKDKQLAEKPIYYNYTIDVHNQRISIFPLDVDVTSFGYDNEIYEEEKLKQMKGDFTQSIKQEVLKNHSIEKIISNYTKKYIKTYRSDLTNNKQLRLGKTKKAIIAINNSYMQNHIKDFNSNQINQKIASKVNWEYEKSNTIQQILSRYEYKFIKQIIIDEDVKRLSHWNTTEQKHKTIKDISKIYLYHHPLSIMKRFLCDDILRTPSFQTNMQNQLKQLDKLNKEYFHYYPKPIVKTFIKDEEDIPLSNPNINILSLQQLFKNCHDKYKTNYLKAIICDQPSPLIVLLNQSSSSTYIRNNQLHSIIDHYQSKYERLYIFDNPSPNISIPSSYQCSSSYGFSQKSQFKHKTLKNIEQIHLSKRRINVINSDEPSVRLQRLDESNKRSNNSLMKRFNQITTANDLQMKLLSSFSFGLIERNKTNNTLQDITNFIEKKEVNMQRIDKDQRMTEINDNDLAISLFQFTVLNRIPKINKQMVEKLKEEKRQKEERILAQQKKETKIQGMKDLMKQGNFSKDNILKNSLSQLQSILKTNYLYELLASIKTKGLKLPFKSEQALITQIDNINSIKSYLLTIVNQRNIVNQNCNDDEGEEYHNQALMNNDCNTINNGIQQIIHLTMKCIMDLKTKIKIITESDISSITNLINYYLQLSQNLGFLKNNHLLGNGIKNILSKSIRQTEFTQKSITDSRLSISTWAERINQEDNINRSLLFTTEKHIKCLAKEIQQNKEEINELQSESIIVYSSTNKIIPFLKLIVIILLLVLIIQIYYHNKH